MPTSAEHLRTIKTFPSLVKYLRDELEWPIESDKFDDLTFEYQPEELGLDAKTAVKIKEIKQLRPLVRNQPWGIFFINFEPKNLPVIALRRILSHLVIKKRKSANTAERPAWAPHDLLFISSYGETDHRDITFAQFSENDGDLPSLRVLSWDDEDTAAHLEHAHNTLKEQLRWPENTSDLVSWRKSWSSAFTLKPREVVNTSKMLAVRLAELATIIRKRVNKILKVESEKGPFQTLYASFKEALIHDLKPDDFADMYAQTITYGFLSARISNPNRSVAEKITEMPITNPFLQDLLSTFLTVGGRKGKIDFDEVGINEVVQVLRDANMEAVLRDFGDRNPQEDPVVHFYELFLKEYDPKKRMQRGVFYTPRPVVSYIVRSVDEILRKEFGLADGLADTATWGQMVKRQPEIKIPEGAKADDSFVQILDPATGTGTFLVEVIGVIHKTMVAKWTGDRLDKGEIRQKWNEYVSDHLLPRLYGFELMMAPYAVAHMKIGLKLHDTGYDFKSHERARIYLTNSLEPAHGFSGQLELDAPALAHEAQAVNEVKNHKRFTIVIGNPPYAGHSSNTGDWISGLVDDYYFVDGVPLGERNSKWLQDDYVKFIRLAQYCISLSDIGVLGFITNHGYIDNPTFRGMRQSLHNVFREVLVLDLHGNSKKKEQCPDGSIDENVFDIQQGVAVLIGSCRHYENQRIGHQHLYGLRTSKYEFLGRETIGSVKWSVVSPATPFYLLHPQNSDLRSEYNSFLRITDVMPVNVLGFQTHRDNFAVDFDKDVLQQRMADFRAVQMSDAEIKNFFEVSDNRDWNVHDARRKIRSDQAWKINLIQCSYRPFDFRYCYFSTVAMDYPRRELLTHVVHHKNLCLGVGRQGIAVQDPVWSLVSISQYPVDANIFRRGGINIFPLYLYADTEDLGFYGDKRPNFHDQFPNTLASLFRLAQRAKGEMPSEVSPEDVVCYAYAVFHSPGYRIRYAEFLKIDFPRLPLTSSLELFRALARLGGELVALHLLESPKLDKPITQWRGTNPSSEIEKITYSDETVWIDKAKTEGFQGVPEPVWNFHIGGYQVCEKWLKDRKSRKLSKEDIEYYQKIVVALNETIRLMKEIDEVIKKHGGWPTTFVGGTR